jgi:phenylacetate-coenzyme A ligase PaaK-like adenylate-forming protein
MKKKHSYFYNPFDYLEQEQKSRQILAKINKLFKYAKGNSPFYSSRLPDAPVESLNQLQEIPILKQEELRANLPPDNQGLLTGPLESAYVFTSGGTTGDPKFTFYNLEDIHNQSMLAAKGFYLPGIRENSRAANFMNAGNLWASFVFVNKALEQCGSLILPIAAQSGTEVAASFIRKFNVDAGIGIPSFFISLADYCETNKIDNINLELIATGGEQIYPETKDYISKILGVKKFVSAGYSSNDTGLIGFNCEHLEGSIHHIHEDAIYLEIVDPESLQPVEDGKPGKILVTCLNRYLMPLIRYDIGDMGMILKEPCSCGRTLKLMQLMGRSDDTLIISGYNITPAIISSLINQSDVLSYHFQIEAVIKNERDLLRITIETKAKTTSEKRDELSASFLSTLLSEEKALQFLVDSNSTLLPEIIIASPGTLPRNPKTGKIKQVIDKRG